MDNLTDISENGYTLLKKVLNQDEITFLKEQLRESPKDAAIFFLKCLDKTSFVKNIGPLINFDDWAHRCGGRSRGFGVHQDSYQRPTKVAGGDHDYALRFGVYLENYKEHSGCIGFIRGSHKTGQMHGLVSSPASEPGDVVVWYVATGHTPNAVNGVCKVPKYGLLKKLSNQVYKYADKLGIGRKFHDERNVLFITLGRSENFEWKKYLKVLSHREYYLESAGLKKRVLDFNGKNITTFNDPIDPDLRLISKEHVNRGSEFFN